MSQPREAIKAALSRPASTLYVSAVADQKGGAETVLLEMLRSPRIRPSLAVPGPGALADFAVSRGIPVFYFDLGAVASVRRPARPIDLWRAGRDALRVARRLAEIAHASDADIVHTNGLKVHVTGVLSRKLYGTPTVMHQHDVPYSRAERLIWRGLAAGALHTIAASDLCFPDMPRPGRLSVVMQGVDAPPARGPRRLGQRPVLGFVGRFHPFKGLHLLLDWFETVATDFPTLTLLLRGRASAEGDAYWAALQPRVERLVASGRCRIEDWRDSGADPFEEIDLLIAPSATPEVGPRVIMEAMLRGIPAIGYPAGGALRMIPALSGGALVADADALRHALHRLLEPTGYAAASEAALSHASSAFGIERFWNELADSYDIARSRGSTLRTLASTARKDSRQ